MADAIQQKFGDKTMRKMFAMIECALLATVGSAIFGSASDLQASPPVVQAEELVNQLDNAEFRKREAAEKELVALGAKAIPAVRAGLKHRDPEVVQRCERLLALLGKVELARFCTAFLADTNRIAKFDHPIWNRYVAIVGDSKPSRELFAALLKREDWARILDNAEAEPARAGELYQAAMRGVGTHYEANGRFRFLIPIWPCDQPEEVVYLLLLGSHKNTDPAYPLSEQRTMDQQFASGESRVRQARGLGLAFRGKRLAINPDKRDRSIEVDDAGGNAAESARVMLTLLGRWLEQRNLWSIVSEHLQGLSAEQQKLLLPCARRVIADTEAPMLCRATWIAVLRRFGDKTDAVRLTPLFEDKTCIDRGSTNRFGKGTDRIGDIGGRQAQVREVAIGSAIFLCGGNPGDFDFECLANQKLKKNREDEIPSTLFPVKPTGTNEEKDKSLARAIQWLDAAGKK